MRVQQHGHKKYWGIWKTNGEVNISIKYAKNFITHREIVFAIYGEEEYEGRAIVVYVRNKIIYIVDIYHCSCSTFAEEWSPEPTTIEALKVLNFGYIAWNSEFPIASIYAWHEYIDKLCHATDKFKPKHITYPWDL